MENFLTFLFKSKHFATILQISPNRFFILKRFLHSLQTQTSSIIAISDFEVILSVEQKCTMRKNGIVNLYLTVTINPGWEIANIEMVGFISLIFSELASLYSTLSLQNFTNYYCIFF